MVTIVKPAAGKHTRSKGGNPQTTEIELILDFDEDTGVITPSPDTMFNGKKGKKKATPNQPNVIATIRIQQPPAPDQIILIVGDPDSQGGGGVCTIVAGQTVCR